MSPLVLLRQRTAACLSPLKSPNPAICQLLSTEPNPTYEYPREALESDKATASSVLRQRISALPSPLKSPTPAIYRDGGGNLRPGKGGIVLGLNHLEALAAALARAVEVARESGRLRDG